MNEIYSCSFCKRVCKNLNSLRNHERLCKLNPNREQSPFVKYNRERGGAWNKGLTKETSEKVLLQSQHCSQTTKGRPGRIHTEQEKEKLREAALRNGLGGFHMRKGIYYNGIKLDSSYEVRVAEELDLNKIVWERPNRFAYHLEGTLHYYTPDFYLPEYNVYLDPKNDFLINNINPVLGYKDIDKIIQVEKENGIKIIVLNKEELNWNSIYKKIQDATAPVV